MYSDNNVQGAIAGLNSYNIAEMTTLFHSVLVKGYNSDQHLAVIRALLRHGTHEDGAHYHAQTSRGLHPAFVLFNSTPPENSQCALNRQGLVEGSFANVLDAITMQDCLDGGISILVHCPGMDSTQISSAEQITVDLYITPRELVRNDRLKGDAAVLVQAFCQEFAFPHLWRFMSCCNIEQITPPSLLPVECINIHSPPYLPHPMSPVSSHIACNAVQAPVSGVAAKSALVQEAVVLNTTPKKTSTSVPSATRAIRQRRPAEVFLLATSATLDRFNFGDELIPSLRKLVETTRDTRWEAKLHEAPWNLTFEQAFNLSRVLSADLCSDTPPRDMKKRLYLFISTFLQLLGVATLCGIVYFCALMLFQNFNLLVRHKKSERFKADLDHGFQQLDTIINGLAGKHHKSVQQVKSQLHIGHSKSQAQRSKISAWNAFCWKKHHEDAVTVMDSNTDTGSQKRETLPNLVREYWEDYHKLTDAEKQELIEQFSQVKKGKDIGVRVFARSRINDFTQTLKVVENELHNLKSRTGMETVLYSACGTTDVRIRGVTFATEGVKNFMGTVMGIDDQDLISKMGSFAIQGTLGAANNHRQQLNEMHSRIRDIINKSLCTATGDADAKMQWKYYFCNVVSRYKVAIKGWPDEVPFKNLSEVSCSLALLEMLYQKWKDKEVSWEELSPAKYEKLCRTCNEQISRGEITEPVHRLWSDRGTKRMRDETSDQNRCKKKQECRNHPV
ncbi:hypothetical protein JVT61DRAFT_7412 [Boletus reticuloceps]|uniref:Uncharacterized protein n=1 Tax=Boletus reticuloceps TaxID=495285 RepID=A0A8I2YIU2_9AGAM|nr:hypothetical protein JVT61DRAFT_7412 [Boletus reticuloceps]